jgi:cytochrome c
MRWFREKTGRSAWQGPPPPPTWLTIGAALTMVGLVAACSGEAKALPVPGGDPQRGKVAIAAYGCGTCHVVPGVAGAQGMVGPPLTKFARRSYIAGEVPNTTRQLIQWIAAPQSIEPGTVMPNLGVTPGEARDIAAYLYTLR